MVIMQLATGTTTAATPISFSSAIKTNDDLIVNSDSVEVPIPGIYEVCGDVTLTSAGEGNYGVTVCADGADIGNKSINKASASGEISTVPVYGICKIERTSETGYVAITVVPVGTPTIGGSQVTIKRIL